MAPLAVCSGSFIGTKTGRARMRRMLRLESAMVGLFRC
jgi:hypothetical protein